MYKHLIFDLDDTLLDFRKGEQVGLMNIFRDHGLENQVDEAFATYQTINRGLWAAYERGEINKDQIHNTRFGKLFESFDRAVDGIALEKEYRQYLNQNYFVLDGAEDLLKNLVNQGYKLIAGTNGEQRTQELRLEHTGFGRYFDAIFGHRQDMDREESIMIGDGLASDIQGGNRYNLDTLWVNLHQQVNETPYQATYEVNELPTIMQIVSK